MSVSPIDRRCPQAGVVVASANAELRERLLQGLARMHWHAVEVAGGAEALSQLESGAYEAVVLDRWLPDLDVEELKRWLERTRPEVDVAIVEGEEDGGIRLVKTPQHIRSHQLPFLLGGDGQIRKKVMGPEKCRRAPLALPGVSGECAAMRRVAELVRIVAPRRTTVLLTGATGTGKEVVARALHALSPRAQRPFVALHCAALPESLLESELFGYLRGAFTGAGQAKTGRIQAAEGGTLLLDEIGELPLAMQVKLLRFLESGELYRLGSVEAEKPDVRIVAATNAELKSPAPDKPFRADLYFRLSVFPIELPPLRERGEDVLLLARAFLERLAIESGSEIIGLSAEVEGQMVRYTWPGNVRELEHAIERAVILAGAERSQALEPRHFEMFPATS